MIKTQTIFFFNDTATTEIYTLSLHDALPICYVDVISLSVAGFPHAVAPLGTALTEDQLALLWRLADEPILCFDGEDRKSTRLNSSHANISYAVFCLKKKLTSPPLI